MGGESSIVDTGTHKEPVRPWWREAEVGLLLLLVVVVYFSRLGDLTLRGEETRWAHIACEMLRTHDWVVPRQQGEPFFSRPPLGNWLIAMATLARGECDVWAVRLPTALATLALTLLIYRYSRTFLSTTGALAAGAVYATFGQVLELGRLAETDALFTALLGGALLVWHGSLLRAGRPAWAAGYFLAALATLAKGPQAPIYFGASVGVFLVLSGHRRELWSRRHLLGLGTFAVVVGCWQVAFLLKMGALATRLMWTSDTGLRFVDQTPSKILGHLMGFPGEVLVCTLPWSPLLALFASRRLRRSLGTGREPVQFLATCLAVCFPTCWLVPGARPRYIMSMYPCLAPLIGLVIERCLEAEAGSRLSRHWRAFLLACGMVMVVAAGLVLVGSTRPIASLRIFDQPALVALLYVGATLGLAAVVLGVASGAASRWRRSVVLAVAVFVGMTGSGVLLSYQVRKSEVAAPVVARLKGEIPPEERLVSLGPVHSLFLYHYRDAIEIMPGNGQELSDDVVYFCLDHYGPGVPRLPFAWQTVGVVNCERYRSDGQGCQVFVGRRVRPVR
ncbi:MAG: glycosyltransferase family 39 protein [Gemmataceae bacterium]|nr:glycosyltransferase family 39 protein [Gemmataceae bacterium]